MKTNGEHKGTFKKIAPSEKRMYGPRALLVCGYPEEEHPPFMTLFERTGLAGVSVIFATSKDLESSVGDLLTRQDKTGLKETSPMPRAVIMSGLTQKELHALMGGYRKAGFPRPLWASLTPVSEHWSLASLLKELEAEAQSIKKQGK